MRRMRMGTASHSPCPSSIEAMRTMSVSFLAKKLELAFGGGLDFGDVGSELAEAEQLAGGEEFVADGAAAGGVYGTDDGLAIFVDDREDVVVRDGLVIEEVGAVDRKSTRLNSSH